MIALGRNHAMNARVRQKVVIQGLPGEFGVPGGLVLGVPGSEPPPCGPGGSWFSLRLSWSASGSRESMGVGWRLAVAAPEGTPRCRERSGMEHV